MNHEKTQYPMNARPYGNIYFGKSDAPNLDENQLLQGQHDG